jgi:hypothetical protein
MNVGVGATRKVAETVQRTQDVIEVWLLIGRAIRVPELNRSGLTSAAYAAIACTRTVITCTHSAIDVGETSRCAAWVGTTRRSDPLKCSSASLLISLRTTSAHGGAAGALTGVAYAVGVGIKLVHIGFAGAIVENVRPIVAVLIAFRQAEARAWVARVAEAIIVGILLTGVGHVRAVVARHAVTIGIGIAFVGTAILVAILARSHCNVATVHRAIGLAVAIRGLVGIHNSWMKVRTEIGIKEITRVDVMHPLPVGRHKGKGR